MVFNAILVVFIGLAAFAIFKETSIMFFVKRLMSTTVRSKGSTLTQSRDPMDVRNDPQQGILGSTNFLI